MNQSAIVAPYLAKATEHLRLAGAHLDNAGIDEWTGFAIDALARAIAEVAMAIDRLSELVVDD